MNRRKQSSCAESKDPGSAYLTDAVRAFSTSEDRDRRAHTEGFRSLLSLVCQSPLWEKFVAGGDRGTRCLSLQNGCHRKAPHCSEGTPGKRRGDLVPRFCARFRFPARLSSPLLESSGRRP